MTISSRAALFAVVLAMASALSAQDPGTEAAPPSAETSVAAAPAAKKPDLPRGALRWRHLGPAMMSGRISDIAVHPTRPGTWYIAVASGGVWKTHSAGTTWTPIFDGEGSYSIGALTLDPHDQKRIWVGTGENNSQRSVGYGDGLYRSDDGGDTWRRVGLEKSEHIAKIIVHPHDPAVVYVAAQGPLWAAGGDRGLYKSEDGGQTWNAILQVDEHTGVTDLVMDPHRPDHLLAATYQRRRHPWTLVNGGPGSGLHRSTDGGRTWTKITRGLPGTEIGRIGLALAPSHPERVYAIVEAAEGKGGFYSSDDFGLSFDRRSDHVSTSPQYYQELVVDPQIPERVYSLDTFLHRSDDGGRTWFRYPEDVKHVDNHALWIDPANSDHLIAGCDGGVYESYDLGKTWDFKDSLSITQFYRVTPDDALPFYNVYGGTQDNATQGGPSRTRNRRGIRNADWFVTVFGDGFETVIEPGNPDIVYSQWQYGGLVRYDRRTGETVDIQPQVGPEEPALRWNWDAPLIVSRHVRERIYYAAQRVFRSDDRGQSWLPISGDLTRQIDRNALPVMGRVQSVDAVAKNKSTSIYGNITVLAESPRVPELLYIGCDDGRIQVTEDGGQSWRAIDAVPGVPEYARVSDIEASLHDDDVVYVSFMNYQMGDFKPYVFKSVDRGLTFEAIAGDLPERGSVYTFAEDHIDPQLLFVGTEFGVFTTVDGGTFWHSLKSGLPTIAVRDLEIQRRESDLVIATFGRGIAILDDYSALRGLSEPIESPVRLFPVRRTFSYIEAMDYDTRFQGHGHWTAENPPFGALITYEVKEDWKTRRTVRREAEKKAIGEGKDTPYPSFDALREESQEEAPKLLLTISDANGRAVRELVGATTKGLHRLAYDLRHTSKDPVRLGASEVAPWENPQGAPLVAAGTYRVRAAIVRDGVREELPGEVSFEVVALNDGVLPALDPAALQAFQAEVSEVVRVLQGAARRHGELEQRVRHLRAALSRTPGAPPELTAGVRAMEAKLRTLRLAFRGDEFLAGLEEATHPGLLGRLDRVRDAAFSTTGDPTRTHRTELERVRTLAAPELATLSAIADTELPALEARFEAAGAPWTPGR